MNYLQLCQRVRQECADVGSGPTTVTGQTGLLGRIVSWVADSYTELQNRYAVCPNWRWLRHGFTVDTVADDDSYAYGDVTDTTTSAAITRLSTWRIRDCDDPPNIYLTSSGVGTQTPMTYIDWDTFKYIYKRGTQNASYPIHISEDPHQNLVIGPKPNGIYTVTGDYLRSAQILALDADTPEMPSQFHMIIVYRAMIRYGFREISSEIIDSAREDYRVLLRQLEQHQLDQFKLAGPMA